MPQNPDASVTEKLRSAILRLDLVPGEKLSERGLESLLGASRTPIRAALMTLENSGLTQRSGRGWQVTPIDLAEIRSVMEFRESVEAAAVALAVERADDDEIAALRLLAEAHADHDADDDSDGETVLRDGGDFHTALARASRNPFLAAAMTDALTRLSRTRWLEVRTAASRATARAEHLEIIAAVEARDAARASALVIAHSRGTRDRLLGYLADERRRLRGHGFAIVDSAAPH